MITKLRIQNFKCLRDTTIDLAPLTVLIGPNDSGKTSILEIIHLIGRSSVAPLSELFHGPHAIENVTWRRQLDQAPGWELRGTTSPEHGADELLYRLSLSASPFDITHDNFQYNKHQVVRDGRSLAIRGTDQKLTDAGLTTSICHALHTHMRREFAPAADAFSSTGIYRLDPRELRSAATPREGDVLSPSGNNLAAILDGLLSGPDRRSVNHMEDALRRSMPTLDGFSTPPAPGGASGEKTINFVLADSGKKPITIPCQLASDGAMLLTAFLALAYSDTPEVLLIEEPENGLHPARLREVIELLRAMTTGAVGNKRRQVILTTHSPLLLNYARPEEVRIVRRDAERGTQVMPLTAVAGIDDLLDEFGIGELWYMLGEEGLAKGRSQ